jgi:hypothetical protein
VSRPRTRRENTLAPHSPGSDRIPFALHAVEYEDLLAPIDDSRMPARGGYGRDFAPAKAVCGGRGIIDGAFWTDKDSVY